MQDAVPELVLVTCFLERSTEAVRTLDDFFEKGKRLLQWQVPKLMFIETHLMERCKTIAQDTDTMLVPFSKQDLTYDTSQLTNRNQNGNPSKNTLEYYAFMNEKTEFVRRATKLRKGINYMWVDFGIYHMMPLNFPSQALEIVRLTATKIRYPGIWSPEASYREGPEFVNWVFAGCLFAGAEKVILEFADAAKEECEEAIRNGYLTWEVNIWYRILKKKARSF